MRLYYCRKCKADSLTPICDHCGAQITSLNQNERFKWHVRRLPAADSPTVLGAFKLLGLTLFILVLFLFLGEIIFSPDKQSAMTMFTNSGILPWTLIIFAVGTAFVMFFLALQGAEELHFIIDARGAHLQVWIEPTRRNCFARFINYEENSFAHLPDGSVRLLVNEVHLVWQDVCRYEVRRHARRIDLYRPSGFRFMSVYAEEGELDALIDYMKPRMKHLAQPAK